MKTKLYLWLWLMVFSTALPAQTSTQSYVLARKMLSASGTSGDYIDQVQYYDGLGRPNQLVVSPKTTALSSVVTLQEYDAYGRESVSWLPTPYGTNANYQTVSGVQTAAKGTTGYNDTRPFTTPTYEPSPLNRVKTIHGPGASWSGKPVKTDYLTNTASEVTRYTVVSGALSSTTSTYGAGQLYVVKSTDEDGKTYTTYTDKQGQLVMEQRGNLKTSYVYDDRGNLCFVLPPAYLASPNLALYAYQYKYDSRNRLTEKKLPGCDAVTFYYDKADNLVLSQTGEERARSKMRFYLYDQHQRLVLTGLCTAPSTSNLSNVLGVCTFTAANSGIASSGYNCSAFTISSPTDVVVNYYDNYSFLSLTGFTNSKFTSATYSGGHLTGSRTALSDATKAPIYTVLHYDTNGRVVKQVSSNHLSDYDTEVYSYTFAGLPLTVTSTHEASGKSTRTWTTTYVYDQLERLTSLKHKLGTGSEVVLGSYSYDGMGRMTNKKVHSTQASINYTYNVRSWLTKISGTPFEQELRYTNTFNGNISEMTWKAGSESTVRRYKFTYDANNRLTGAAYGEGTAISTNLNRFTENLGYDNGGKVTSVQRYGRLAAGTYGLLDNLSFEYTGNQLKKVSDAVSDTGYSGAMHFIDGANSATEYTYDKNGNMISDLNKKISKIEYNCLNLPLQVTFSTDASISYLYDMAGVKRQTIHKSSSGSSTTTDYCGGVVYENGSQKSLLTAEGYITLSNSTYYYFVKDHLCNNRVVVNQSGAVQQVTHYYPFGASFADGTGADIQRYKYNGKELDANSGLNLYDYGARMYDPVLANWSSVDPMAESYYSIRPYAYVDNNPVRYTDPDGMDIWEINQQGYISWISESKKHQLYALDKDGNRSGDPITIKDRSILDNLTGTDKIQSTTVGKESVNDLFKVFKFAADNTSSEWVIYKYNQNNKSNYTLGTRHEKENAGNPGIYGVKATVDAKVHSHPGISSDRKSELSSMGVTKNNKIYDVGDWANVVKDIQRNGAQRTLSYVYFPNTTNLYHISGSGPAYIRKINENSNRFFFGTFK